MYICHRIRRILRRGKLHRGDAIEEVGACCSLWRLNLAIDRRESTMEFQSKDRLCLCCRSRLNQRKEEEDMKNVVEHGQVVGETSQLKVDQKISQNSK